MIVAVAVLLAAGCQWPRDAEGTLDRVRGGVLRVGVVEDPPWTVVDDRGAVGGAEAALVERLAAELGARVEWTEGPESTLIGALSHQALDLVIGGMTRSSPWTKEVALTVPYFTSKRVVAVPLAADSSLEGVPVAVEAGTPEVTFLAEEGAVPVVVDEVPAGVPAVVPDWAVDPACQRAVLELGSTDHSFAMALGENAFLVRVEEFLLALPPEEIRGLLVQARGGTGCGR
ncbi:substrate-binding periplasmic protein [Actinokineospora fastidiosa]|uniref:Solute-binding protein family 3/N-terminal domain-containing protein n=1 Tax=Actinokineospora fastidiosa TaxID=1816 RepID=A0A918GGP7_9PSEU|nr:transporter substrate-binding domain-containing protein [Actinokineospora fastidiosa]GGS36550.1 hypothetical protein GCM10010171_34180 [Actinokineospora fastidiosa]